MDQEEQQNQQPTIPSVTQSAVNPISHSDRNKSGMSLWKLLSVLLVLVLLVGSAGAGYLYYNEVNTHNVTKEVLAEVSDELKDINHKFEQNAQVIQDATLEPGFRSILQENANRSCSSNSAILFNTTTSPEKNNDGTTKKMFAVGQYICNRGESISEGAIRFVAAQSYDQATWEFTYGSSTVDPVSLPGYIFDTDPALFNRKYNNPKSF